MGTVWTDELPAQVPPDRSRACPRVWTGMQQHGNTSTRPLRSRVGFSTSTKRGLLAELAARYYLERGWDHLAHHYLRDAHYAYECWGARAKGQGSRGSIPSGTYSIYHQGFESMLRTSPVTSTTEQRLASSALDWLSLVKASQAISSELEWDRLLYRLLHIAIESAGAQRGLLLLPEGPEWIIAGEASPQRDGLLPCPRQPADRSTAKLSFRHP